MTEQTPDRPEFTVEGRSFRLTVHAWEKMSQRGIALDEIVRAVTHGETFAYFHDRTWKDGYYEQETGLFIGVVSGSITTVIKGVSERYISSLKRAGEN